MNKEEAHPLSAPVWRTGEAGRTIWWGEYTLHGMVGSAEIATRICDAMNDVERLRFALKAIVDEVTDDAHEDSEDFDEAVDSLMKILRLAKDALHPPVTP